MKLVIGTDYVDGCADRFSADARQSFALEKILHPPQINIRNRARFETALAYNRLHQQGCAGHLIKTEAVAHRGAQDHDGIGKVGSRFAGVAYDAIVERSAASFFAPVLVIGTTLSSLLSVVTARLSVRSQRPDSKKSRAFWRRNLPVIS